MDLENSAAELVRISRDNKKLNDREKFHGSTKNGLPWIGPNNQYMYGRWSVSKKVSVSCFRYSGIDQPRRCQLIRSGVCEPVHLPVLNFIKFNADANVVTKKARIIFRNEFVGVETGVIVLSQRIINRIVKSRIRKLLPAKIIGSILLGLIKGWWIVMMMKTKKKQFITMLHATNAVAHLKERRVFLSIRNISKTNPLKRQNLLSERGTFVPSVNAIRRHQFSICYGRCDCIGHQCYWDLRGWFFNRMGSPGEQ